MAGVFDYVRNNDPGDRAHHHGFVSNRRTYTMRKHYEIAAWCREHYGEAEDDYSGRWCHIPPKLKSVGIFFFLEEDAAFHFRMRWC